MNKLDASEKVLTFLVKKVSGLSSFLQDAIVSIQKAKIELSNLTVLDDGYGSNKDESCLHSPITFDEEFSGIVEENGRFSSQSIQNKINQRIESNDQRIESNDQSNESNDQSNESNDQSNESDDQRIESDDQRIESDDQRIDRTPSCSLNVVNSTDFDVRDGFTVGKVVGSLTKKAIFWFKPEGLVDENCTLDRFEGWRSLKVHQLVRIIVPCVGHSIAFQDTQCNSWKRGLVENAEPNRLNEIRVRCVDTGEVHNVFASSIYELPDSIKTEPYLAKPCCLFKDLDFEMPYEARWAFSDNVTGRDIKVRSREKCQIDGMIIHVVDLFSVDETVDVNSEVLVKVKDHLNSREKRKLQEPENSAKYQIANDEHLSKVVDPPLVNGLQHHNDQVVEQGPNPASFRCSSIEVSRLQSIFMQKDPQFVIVMSNFTKIVEGFADGCFYLNAEATSEIKRKFESLVKEQVFFIVLKRNHKRREWKKEYRQICAVGLVTSEIYRGFMPRRNSYSDKVNMAYISCSKLSTPYTGVLRDGFKLFKGQGVMYVEQMIQELLKGSAIPLDVWTKGNTHQKIQTLSNRYLTEQEVAQRSENMSSTFDAPFFETRNNTIEDDWDGDLLLENTADNQDKADKSFDGSQNTLEELRLSHACNSAKEDKVEDVPPWKMTSIEMVDDEIKTQASESTMEVKEDFQEQNYCETNAAVTPNNPNTDVDSHSSNTSPTNDILKDAEETQNPLSSSNLSFPLETESNSYVFKIQNFFDSDPSSVKLNATVAKTFIEEMRVKYNKMMYCKTEENVALDESFRTSEESIDSASFLDGKTNVSISDSIPYDPGTVEDDPETQDKSSLKTSEKPFERSVSPEMNFNQRTDVVIVTEATLNGTSAPINEDETIKEFKKRDLTEQKGDPGTEREKRPDRLIYKVFARQSSTELKNTSVGNDEKRKKIMRKKVKKNQPEVVVSENQKDVKGKGCTRLIENPRKCISYPELRNAERCKNGEDVDGKLTTFRTGDFA